VIRRDGASRPRVEVGRADAEDHAVRLAEREALGSGSVNPAKRTWPSTTSAATRFIDGEPIKAATKRFADARILGVSYCWRTPSS
jgi:hypothetical protein